MPNEPIVTLLTDFGLSDPFVGVMKGVVLARVGRVDARGSHPRHRARAHRGRGLLACAGVSVVSCRDGAPRGRRSGRRYCARGTRRAGGRSSVRRARQRALRGRAAAGEVVRVPPNGRSGVSDSSRRAAPFTAATCSRRSRDFSRRDASTSKGSDQDTSRSLRIGFPSRAPLRAGSRARCSSWTASET